MADVFFSIGGIPFLFLFALLIGILFMIFLRLMEKRNKERILQNIAGVKDEEHRGESAVPGSHAIVDHDVYITYASPDKPVADAMCATLESAGIRCWIAPRDLQRRWDPQEQSRMAIDTCTVLVVIFSSHANSSLHVSRDCSRALEAGTIIIPFRIQDVLPSDAMKYLIGTPHWLDALTPPLEAHLLRLTENIQSYLRAE